MVHPIEIKHTCGHTQTHDVYTGMRDPKYQERLINLLTAQECTDCHHVYMSTRLKPKREPIDYTALQDKNFDWTNAKF